MSVLTLAGRELRSLFLSPLAWVVLAVVQFILGYVFLTRLEVYARIQPRLLALDEPPGLGDLVVAPLLGTAAIVLLLVTPMLSMRLIAEERRAGTLALLLAAPVSLTAITLGKYLGLMGFLLVMVALTALMPLSLMAGAAIDLGQLAAGLLGLTLVLGAFGAVGLFVSALAAQPTAAGVSTFGLLLLAWIIDWAGEAGAEGGSDLLGYLSMVQHYQALLKGVFSTTDLAYYLLVITGFLALTVWRLDQERLQA